MTNGDFYFEIFSISAPGLWGVQSVVSERRSLFGCSESVCECKSVSRHPVCPSLSSRAGGARSHAVRLPARPALCSACAAGGTLRHSERRAHGDEAEARDAQRSAPAHHGWVVMGQWSHSRSCVQLNRYFRKPVLIFPTSSSYLPHSFLKPVVQSIIII